MARSLRIDPRLDERRPIEFLLDGRAVKAYDGESIAVALIAAGIRAIGARPGAGGSRGVLCTVGHCQECLVSVDGRAIEACRCLVSQGLDVKTL